MYDISVLSNTPLAVGDLLSPNAPPQRLRPLFSIGVHDIPLLEEDLRLSKAAVTGRGSEITDAREEAGCGWIACTTDSILAMKSTLYDVLVTMPPAYAEDATHKVWPKLESPQGVELKATQRDLRRYQTLRWGLSRHVSPPPSPVDKRRGSSELPTEPELPSPRPASSSHARPSAIPKPDLPDTDAIVEPLSWPALAFQGLMWWASSGEQRGDLDEEAAADASLLPGLDLSAPSPSSRPRPAPGPSGGEDASAKQEMAIIAYFHRLTTQLLATMSALLDATDSDDEQDDEQATLVPGHGTSAREPDAGPALQVSSEDVVRMGLDVWSATDHLFIAEMAKLYLGSRARVEGRNVDVCGVRIC